MSGQNEIAALVRLLDDPDENIFDQIKEKLMEIGPECIPSLEKARFEDNYGDLFISRAEHLIHDIGFGTLKKVHEKWLKFPCYCFHLEDIEKYSFNTRFKDG